jgi:phosphatidylinositol alpha-1,6-mannosyltransferase
MGLGRRGAIVAMTLAARAELRRWMPDVTLALHVLAAPGALGKTPLVVVTHGGELRSPRIRPVARWVFPRAERIVANSRYTRTEAIALGADPMRIVVLPVGAPDPVRGLESEAETLRERLGGGRIVLSVARLEPHKGHDRLVRALAALDEDVRLVLVGEGSERAHLERAAADAGVGARVTFAGAVSEEALPVYYTAADAFALPSRDVRGARAGVEGGGIALLEACAYGLPVVAGATGGIPETIREDETGLLVDPDDTAAVARALRRVLDDRALAARLGAAAQAMATGERSWDRFAERMERVLELASKRSREVVG